MRTHSLEARNIILAGFMGTGKTTVGRLLARRLGWKLLDTDRLIEERARMPVDRIFDELGERAFRDMETDVAHSLPAMSNCVIATGGGFVLREENLRAANQAGVVILLMASAEQIWHRVRRSRRRPLLRTDNPREAIEKLLEERREAYNAIPTRVGSDGRSPQAVADEILELLSPS